MASVQFRVWRTGEWKSDVGLIACTNTWREDESEISADWSLLHSPFPSPLSVTCCRPSVLMCSHPPPAPPSSEQWRQRFSPVPYYVCPWMLPLRLTSCRVGSRAVMTLIKSDMIRGDYTDKTNMAHHMTTSITMLQHKGPASSLTLDTGCWISTKWQ